MLGEEVESSKVVWYGFYGNRSYALVDAESSRLVSAKNPAKWGRMFECRSRLIGDLGSDKPPRVQIALPTGVVYDIKEGEYGDAEDGLSRFLGRRVKFTAAGPDPRPIRMEQYHPEIEEEPEAGTTTEFSRSAEAQAGTFTDRAAVHIVSTSSLKALAGAYPSGAFDPLRFRPNILADTGEEEGFTERGWVGRTLAIGDEVKLNVFGECGRCVMTTIPQGDLKSDTGILGAALRFNRGKVGVFGSVLQGGEVRKGDQLRLE